MPPKPKLGRPKLPKGTQKTVFSTRFTTAELESYEKAAKKAGLPIREWLRTVLNDAVG